MKHSISFKENSSCGRFDITIGPKQNMGKTIEGITVTVHMPKVVLNMNLTPTQGSYTFDPVTKVQSPKIKSEQVFLQSLFCDLGTWEDRGKGLISWLKLKLYQPRMPIVLCSATGENLASAAKSMSRKVRFIPSSFRICLFLYIDNPEVH